MKNAHGNTPHSDDIIIAMNFCIAAGLPVTRPKMPTAMQYTLDNNVIPHVDGEDKRYKIEMKQ